MSNLTIGLIKDFYYNKQLSVPEISKRIGVDEKTIYRFMERMSLARRKPEESNRIIFYKKVKSFFLKQKLSEEEEKLKLSGIMLYWTEGAKMNSEKRAVIVDFANSNPQMIQLFLKFLRYICGVDEKRLRVLLYCYTNQNIKKLKIFWQNITKIPLTQFTKPYVRKDFLPEKKDKMKYGLVHIRYCDKKLLIQIEHWIKEYLRKNNIQG